MTFFTLGLRPVIRFCFFKIHGESVEKFVPWEALVAIRSAEQKACVFVHAVLEINAERRTMQLVC